MTTNTNMAQAMAKATQNAKSPTAREARDQAAANRARVAATKNEPMPASNEEFMAQLVTMQAQMAQMMTLITQKDEQIAELKKAADKPAKKEPAPENMGIVVKGNILTITVDLSQDTGKNTANGANLIVAQQNSAVGPYKFTHEGKEHWLSCCVARPYDNAKELRAAYKAAKQAK